MREIKFRGRNYDGEWLEGFIQRNDWNDEWYIFPPQGMAGTTGHKVDPATVGQYIGLKDRNGKEIYEGDILMFHAFLPDVLQDRHLVGWSEDYGFCQWEYVDKEDSKGNIKRYKRSEPYTLYGVSHGTIIGNIHDNPELLKGGEI